MAGGGEPYAVPVVRVVAVDYRVEVLCPDQVDGGYADSGRCSQNHIDPKIYIARGGSPSGEAGGLLHETLHAIWYEMGLTEKDGDEERVVSALGTGLSCVLRDNPAFVGWVLALLGGVGAGESNNNNNNNN